MIDAGKIKRLSEEKIDVEKDTNVTFLNVGRHEEKQKRLSRLIEASKMLKETGYCNGI